MADVLPDYSPRSRGRDARSDIVGACLIACLLLSTSVSVSAASNWEFVDVTAAAGLIYEHGYVGGVGTEMQRMAGGVAAADYDGDGWVDLYVVRVQVNGKLRGKVTVPVDADQPSIQRAAESYPPIANILAEKTVVKVIVVSGRLINFVVR